MEREVFLASPKRQYHVSQCGEHDCSAYHEENGDYNEYPGSPQFTNEH